ncbi:SGNH/GDSL hydrolase family protein [Cohnella sp. GCM10020058]|uniref:SGNH/GDSL hydrolase family protein n=1 Tax=Cohnella sp. GCM10020058 TaxID=3317330 RepID=UPI0036436557
MSNKLQHNRKSQIAESFVFVNEEWQKLRFAPAHSLVLRSATLPTDEGCTVYEEGDDFVVNEEGGAVRRTTGSRIPNWAEHGMYGLTTFDHNRFTDYSNKRFTVYGDYDYEEPSDVNDPIGYVSFNNGAPLTRVIEKLNKGEKVRYIVFGDSISCGGEASRDSLAYYSLFADALRALYPTAEIEVVNRSVGGEGSTGGLARLENDVITLRPDLISIGYGMNDQCRGESIRNGIPPGEFEENIREMVERIQVETMADTILITPCLSNPAWIHSSGDLAIYADILKRIGRELGVGVADVHELWQRELRAGKSHSSMLLNNINHPNDYGHRIYFEALRPFVATGAM